MKSVVKVLVNGKAMDAEEKTNVQEFLGSCRLKAENVIVLVNDVVVKPHLWTETTLAEGDHIELVSLIGGG